PESVKQLASKKQKVIAFTDGDHAGELILRTLLNNVKIDLVAKTPQGKEVEDLTGKEIEMALQNAVPPQQFLSELEKREEKEEVTQKELEKKEEKLAPQITVTEEQQKPSMPLSIEIPENVMKDMNELKGTLEAILYDDNWNVVARVPVRDLYDTLSKLEANKVKTVVFDGIITQRLIDIASQKNVSYLIGARIGNVLKRDEKVVLLSMYDLLS
ncbi:MAG: toprim domain-containing protein, partial [Fervidicoccus sp.]